MLLGLRITYTPLRELTGSTKLRRATSAGVHPPKRHHWKWFGPALAWPPLPPALLASCALGPKLAGR
jgi:hypothetical protein